MATVALHPDNPDRHALGTANNQGERLKVIGNRWPDTSMLVAPVWARADLERAGIGASWRRVSDRLLGGASSERLGGIQGKEKKRTQERCKLIADRSADPLREKHTTSASDRRNGQRRSRKDENDVSSHSLYQHKNVVVRRDLHYCNYDELLADAQRLTEHPVQTLGNWNQAQNYKHIAMALDTAIDGAPFMLPAPAHWLMSLLIKRKFLTKALPPGFKTSKDLVASEEFTLDESMADWRTAVERQKSLSKRAVPRASERSVAKNGISSTCVMLKCT